MKFNESQVNPADAKEVFKIASEVRSKPQGLGKLFKGLRKDKVEINDLQQAWKDEGYPDDTRDLAAILKGHGFSKKEIDKVFQSVFGGDSESSGPVASPAIQHIVNYAKENGLADNLKAFLQKEYGFKESYSYEGKAVIEDIRQIFTNIVNEERTERNKLIKTQEQTLLGRTKK
jgi:hypothetical protein